jgi:hypothetical protein
VVTATARKSLQRLSRPDRERIVRAIDALPAGDVGRWLAYPTSGGFSLVPRVRDHMAGWKSQPLASHINWAAQQTVANLAGGVALSSDGAVRPFVNTSVALVLDLEGSMRSSHIPRRLLRAGAGGLMAVALLTLSPPTTHADGPAGYWRQLHLNRPGFHGDSGY